MNIAFVIETALMVAAAFLIGAIVGYAVRCWFFKPEKAATPAAPEKAPAPTPTPTPAPAAPPAKPATAKPEATPAETAQTAPETKSPDSPADADGKPAGLDAPRGGKKDDLKRIKGIGPKIEGTLNELGIYHFDQIAGWNDKTVDWINGFLSFKGRIQREKWIEQAKELAKD